ncbi:hypothetical protein Tsubulata_001664 [Turnera subulata]|uniref:Uncharacterized protein n=1 Tax=Turnera subulata TaxID=218843 RepID=A0A9Q0FW58_9ROSI|nr:hypothetical protein Tsubulata_001664 [Turnera subulata]
MPRNRPEVVEDRGEWMLIQSRQRNRKLSLDPKAAAAAAGKSRFDVLSEDKEEELNVAADVVVPVATAKVAGGSKAGKPISKKDKGKGMLLKNKEMHSGGLTTTQALREVPMQIHESSGKELSSKVSSKVPLKDITNASKGMPPSDSKMLPIQGLAIAPNPPTLSPGEESNCQNLVDKPVAVCPGRPPDPHSRSLDVGMTKEGVQKALAERPNPFLFRLEDELLEEYHCILSQEEIFWHQKSRLKWMIEGDRNTRFFHVSTILRRKHNRVEALKTDEGEWIWDEGGNSLKPFDSIQSAKNLWPPAKSRVSARDLVWNCCQVETLLDKENVSLDELLDEDEIIQECKALNGRLINL